MKSERERERESGAGGENYVSMYNGNKINSTIILLPTLRLLLLHITTRCTSYFTSWNSGESRISILLLKSGVEEDWDPTSPAVTRRAPQLPATQPKGIDDEDPKYSEFE